MSTFAMVRVAALELPPEAAASERFRRHWRRLIACERALHALARPLSEALHDSRSGHPAGFHREIVLPVRRDVHNGRAPRAAVRAALGDLPTRIPLLARWLRALDERERCRAALPEAVAAGLAADRRTLGTMCTAEPLRRAAALTSHALLRGLSRAAACGPNPDSRARKAEPSILRYALRASSKTSPLSWFTYVGWGQWFPGPGDDLDDAAPVAHSRVNRAVSTLLIGGVLAAEDLRPHVPHRIAPAAFLADGHIGYRRDMPASLGGFVLTREEQVTLPYTAALRIVWSEVAQPGRIITPARLVETLAGRIPGDPDRSRAAASRYVDRLVEERLLVPVEPVNTHRDDLLDRLADWLAEHGRGELSEPLRDIAFDSHRFGELGAEQRPDMHDRLTTRWRAVLAAVDAQPVDLATVTEDVVLPQRVRLGRRHGEQARADLARLAPLADLFDTSAVLRQLIRDRMVDRYGPGGTCRLAELITDAAGLWTSVARIAPDGTITADPDTRLPAELRELARLRREVTEAVRAGDRDATGEIQIPEHVPSEVAAALPAWLLARPASHAYFVQPFRADDRIGWCVNHVYGGWGRFSSRFLDLIDPRAGRAIAAQLRRVLGAGRVAQFRPVAAFNANLHPLLVDDEVGEDPTGATILVDELELAHDRGTDQVRLRIARTGEQLDVLYLGFLVPFALPDRVAPLFMDLGAGRTSFPHLASRTVIDHCGHRITRRERLRYRDIVLARRAWQLEPSTVDAWRADLERDADVPVAAAARWLVPLGLPDRVFVSSAPGEPMSGFADFQRYLARPKPQYVDMGSALALRCLARLLRRHTADVRIEEALPVPGAGPAGRRVMELVVETYRWRRNT